MMKGGRGRTGKDERRLKRKVKKWMTKSTPNCSQRQSNSQLLLVGLPRRNFKWFLFTDLGALSTFDKGECFFRLVSSLLGKLSLQGICPKWDGSFISQNDWMREWERERVAVTPDLLNMRITFSLMRLWTLMESPMGMIRERKSTLHSYSRGKEKEGTGDGSTLPFALVSTTGHTYIQVALASNRLEWDRKREQTSSPRISLMYAFLLTLDHILHERTKESKGTFLSHEGTHVNSLSLPS